MKGKTMNKQKSRLFKNIVFSAILLCIVAIVCVLVKVFIVEPKEQALKEKLAVGREQTLAVQDFVYMNAGVTEEMLTPEYWIELREKNESDTNIELMSPDDIAWVNDRNRRMIVAGNYEMDLEDISTIFNGDTAEVYIKATYNADKKLLNLENLPWGIDTKFGFSVVSGCMKRYPSYEADYDDGNRYYDNSLQSDLPALMPVAIIHESLDGEWYYAFTYGYGGWVPKENIALCASREEWIERMHPESFLIVTGRELRISTDPYHEKLSGLLLPMGTKIPVVKPSDVGVSFHNRVAYGNYIAKLPIRLDDGSISDEFVLIPVSEDVSLGYPNFTEANIASLLMKHVGNIYGWAGDNNAVDCSGLVHEIYACFGLKLPRGASVQASAKALESFDVKHSGVDRKIEILKEVPIGSLLYFEGHIMMYLGMVDDMPYCISSVGAMGTPGTSGVDIAEVNTVVITNMYDTLRSNGKSWIESVERITVMNCSK